MNEVLNHLLPLAKSWEPVGSRVTCNPPPTNTDMDILVLVERDRADNYANEMASAGFAIELGDGYAADIMNEGKKSPFQSFRSGDVNLIVTVSTDFYERFLIATKVAKRLNLQEKQERIDLFQGVLYANRQGWVS